MRGLLLPLLLLAGAAAAEAPETAPRPEVRPVAEAPARPEPRPEVVGLAEDVAGQVPLDVLGAEFGGFVKSLRSANTELNTGDVLQFALVTEKYITFLSEVTAEYYTLLVMKPDGNYGRARFELEKVKHALRDELI